MRTNLPSNTRPNMTVKNKWIRRSKAAHLSISTAGAFKGTDNVRDFPRCGTARPLNRTVNSVHSVAYEMLRKIAGDLQVSSSTPFTSTSSQSTSEQNCATCVSPSQDTRMWARGFNTRIAQFYEQATMAV